MKKPIIPTLLKLGLSVLFIILILMVFSLFTIIRWYTTDAETESLTNQKFWREVEGLPTFKVTFYKLWEGDAIVHAQVGELGKVTMWYNDTGAPTITGIKGINAEFKCKFKDTGSEFNSGLNLATGSNFKTLIPVEVNNLSDLVKHYEVIHHRIEEMRRTPEKEIVETVVNNKAASCEFPL